MRDRRGRALPNELAWLIFAYAQPIWTWYPPLSSTVVELLFPHDPMRTNRDDLPWVFRISDQELLHRLEFLEHMQQGAEDHLGPLSRDVNRRVDGWRRLTDYLKRRASLCVSAAPRMGGS